MGKHALEGAALIGPHFSPEARKTFTLSERVTVLRPQHSDRRWDIILLSVGLSIGDALRTGTGWRAEPVVQPMARTLSEPLLLRLVEDETAALQ